MTAGEDEKGTENFILLQRFATNYLAAARALLLISQSRPPEKEHLLPIAHLLGLSVELSLKGFISIAQIGTTDTVPRMHDLTALLDTALTCGSNPRISADQRAEIDALNTIYDRPFLVRYPRIGRVTFPDMSALADTAEFLCKSLDAVSRRQDFADPSVRSRLGAEP